MSWNVEYYKKENGSIPVLDFLLTLNPKMRAKAFSEIELLEKHGINLKEPYVKPVKGENYKGLFEPRVKFSSDISRIFYFTFQSNTFVLLHGFTKKTDKTRKTNSLKLSIIKMIMKEGMTNEQSGS